MNFILEKFTDPRFFYGNVYGAYIILLTFLFIHVIDDWL